MDPVTSIGVVVGALSAIGGLFWLVMRISQSFKESIKKELNIETKVKALEDKIEYNKEYIDLKHSESLSEINHIKEIQEGRLRELSNKIDELREQVSKGQQQTMDLLAKILIEKD